MGKKKIEASKERDLLQKLGSGVMLIASVLFLNEIFEEFLRLNSREVGLEALWEVINIRIALWLHSRVKEFQLYPYSVLVRDWFSVL